MSTEDDINDPFDGNVEDDTGNPEIVRIQMSKEEELFYRIKYGHAPGQRLDKKYRTNKETEDLEMYYVLTNIPLEEGGEI